MSQSPAPMNMWQGSFKYIHILKLLKKLKEYPGAAIGLSALLTTTMVNMEAITKQIKEEFPETTVLIGGAPVTEKFKVQIGADFYGPEPLSVVNYLKRGAQQISH